MRTTTKFLLGVLIFLLFILAGRIFIYLNTIRVTTLSEGRLAPQFPSSDENSWLNSRQLQLSEMLGSVIVILVWTYDWPNSTKSLPWLQGLKKTIPDKRLNVLTVHSPEFAHEKNIKNLEEKIEFYELQYPVYIDNDLSYFHSLRSEGWPSIYLIDTEGYIRFIYLGETHSHFAQARDIESKIKLLLNDNKDNSK